VNWAGKLKLITAAFVLCSVAVLSLSRESLQRYLTLFTPTAESSDAAISAAASSRMRQQKLMESIELTLRHPIFGVGMGVFMPASVEIAKEQGGHVDWEVSHNSYTQVSSELGIPGLLLLLAMYATGFRQLWRLDRKAKRAAREDIRQFSFALIVSLCVLCVHFCFDSMAYVFYMPLILGLVAACSLAYQDPEPLNPEIPIAARLPVPASSGLTPPPAGQIRNPYRFGRRR
jgi:O-antigen ligase